MADIAVKYGLGGGGGIHFTDPWMLGPAQTYTAAYIRTATADPVYSTSESSTFWTHFGQHGTVVDSNWTADTYKSFVNHTGKGLIATLLGPEAGGSETTTFEFTLNSGTVVELAVPVTSGKRAIIGLVEAPNSTFAATPIYHDSGTLTSGVLSNTRGDDFAQIPSWRGLKTSISSPAMLYYDISVLIRMKHSANVTATLNQERQAGVIHMTGL